MLNVLRENFKRTPTLRVMLALVGLSMVLSLGYYFVSPDAGAAANWAARVNGVEIPFQEYVDRARFVDSRYQQMFGEAYAQIRQPQRISQEAIESLVQQELIRQDAGRLGLRASKVELAQLIRDSPQFHDETGQFVGTERYLQMVGGKRGATRYERQLAMSLLAERWFDLVGQALILDDDAVEQAWREEHETTRLDFVVVPFADSKVDEEVGDGELRRWFEGHQEDYKREESRRIRFAVIERAKLEGQMEVTDQEIQDYYAANQERYTHPEQRRARHILFRLSPEAGEEAKQALEAKARQAHTRAAAGEDFAALARELSEDTVSAERDGDLGFFARSDMVAPFADAAFATEVGKLAPVTESPFGYHVIQVTGSREQGVSPLEEVREEIRRDLLVQRSQQRLLDEAQRVRNAIGDDPARLEQVAAAEGLTVQSRTIKGRERLADIGATPQFAVSVSQLAAGSVSQPLPLSGGMAIVAVDEVLPPAVPPFEEVRDEVRGDVLEARRREAAIAAGRRALAEHLEFSKVAAALKLDVQDSGEIKMNQGIPGVGAATPELTERLFGDHVMSGQRGTIEVPTGALVYEVSAHQGFDAQAFEAGRSELRGRLLAARRDEYGQAILAQLRDTESVELSPRLAQLE